MTRKTKSPARAELPFVAGAITAAIMLSVGDYWFADIRNPALALALFVWIFVAMLWGAFGVGRHAAAPAERLGEPLGTLILTLSVIGIEVSLITAIMLAGDGALSSTMRYSWS